MWMYGANSSPAMPGLVHCGRCLVGEGCCILMEDDREFWREELKRPLEARGREEGRRCALLLLGGGKTGRGDLNGDKEEL